MTQTLPLERAEELRQFLSGRGYTFESRPHQKFLARGKDAVVSLYESGKVVLGGSSPTELAEVSRFIESLGGSPATRETSVSATESIEGFHETRVGIDEAGKGDYFGPLIASAVLATEYQAKKLLQIGVRDSKALKTPQIRTIAGQIRSEILVPGQWRTVKIAPIRYNSLIQTMGNLNRLLGWAHARTLEEVLKFKEPCSLAIADQFGDPKYIREALFSKGRNIRLVQVPKGERDVVVAAASVLARAEFLDSMQAMRDEFGEEFPLGATHVEQFARNLVQKRGADVLLKTAKVHFATTSRVVSDPQALLANLARSPTAQESSG
jgi:ribonuclease HIII